MYGKWVMSAVAALAVPCVVLGLLGALYASPHMWRHFQQSMVLKPGSLAYRYWQNTTLDVPKISKVYFWNWTNPEQVYDPGYKPSFVEMGPYVFREEEEKVDLQWHNDTVTYRTVKRWSFERGQSSGKLSDRVTSLNVLSASVSNTTRTWSKLRLYPLSMLLAATNQQLTRTSTVSQLLNQGYEVSLVYNSVSGLSTINELLSPHNKKNVASLDVFTVDTGAGGQIGQLRHLNQEDVEQSMKIQGSSDELWWQNLTSDTVLTAMTPEYCQLMTTYRYNGTTEVHGLASGTFEADVYCPTCSPAGVANVTSCAPSIPVFLSRPHFYGAERLAEAGSGFSPSRDRHSSFRQLEMRTGAQLRSVERVQINVLLDSNPILKQFRAVPRLYIPIMWTETSQTVDPSLAHSIKLFLFFVDHSPALGWTVTLFGVALLVSAVAFYVRGRAGERCLSEPKQGPQERDQLQPESDQRVSVKYSLSRAEP